MRPKLIWSKTSEQIRRWAAMRTIIGDGQPLVDETRQRIQRDTRGHRGRFTPTRYAKRGRYYRADVAFASIMIWVAS